MSIGTQWIPFCYEYFLILVDFGWLLVKKTIRHPLVCPHLVRFGLIWSGSEGADDSQLRLLAPPHDWTLQLKVGKPLLNSSVAPQC